jgi:hypothetical protein
MDPNRSFRPGERDHRPGRIPPPELRHSTEFSPLVLVGMGLLMLGVLAAGIWLLLRAA